MARYVTPVTSAAALTADTAFAGVVGTSTVACRIRRIILGSVGGTGAVNDQQMVVGVNRATARGTAGSTLTPGKMDDRSAAAGITGIDTAYSSGPTLAAQDLIRIPWNLKSGVDLPWEQIEELWVPNNTATPVVFVNRTNAVPASTSIVITIEHEE